MESIGNPGVAIAPLRRFELRILKSSWGIHVDLEARTSVSVAPPAHVSQVGVRTWIDLSTVSAVEEDLQYLRDGLARVSSQIESRRTENITVQVQSLTYPLTDYQPEGIAAAMVGWATEEFELPPPNVEISFDRAKNRYLFDWHN